MKNISTIENKLKEKTWIYIINKFMNYVLIIDHPNVQVYPVKARE